MSFENNSIKSFTVEVSLKNTNTISDSFKIHLTRNDKGWVPTVLIVSKGDLNPLDFFSLTFSETKKMLHSFNLDIDSCEIYIDLMECLGIYNPYIFKWETSGKDSLLENHLLEVDLVELPEEDLNTLENYYKDRWSALTSSCLTTEEKIELIVNALSPLVFDKSTVDHLQLSFREKLFEVVEGEGSFLWKFN